MQPYFAGAFGNASSVHRRGEAAREAIMAARQRVAALVGCAPEEVVFTASGSEANNLALKGAWAAPSLTTSDPPRTAIVVSAIEHPSVLETARHLESRGAELRVVPVGADGIVDLDALAAAVDASVAIVSLMWVNNEIGTIQPVAEAAAIARRAGRALPLRRGAGGGQAAARVRGLGDRPAVDRRPQAPRPARRRGARRAPPRAARAARSRRSSGALAPRGHGEPAGHRRTRRRGRARGRADRPPAAPRPTTRAASGCAKGWSHGIAGARLNGDAARRVGSIVNLCFPGVDGEAVLHELDREGITVSTGSACSAATPGPSHVLVALGLRPEDAHASVRFSLGEGTTDADVATMLDVVPGVVARLRADAGSVHDHEARTERHGAIAGRGA
jgi:cysteine desulfurase